MKIIHTIAGTRMDHGGTSRSVPALCEAISVRLTPIHFLTTCPARYDIPYNLPQSPVISHLIKESPQFGRMALGAGFQQILSQVQAEKEIGDSNLSNRLLIHDHGIWLATNHAVAKYARKAKAIRVVSPRGMLSSWAINNGRWKKRIAWWAYQHADLMSATAFHVTSKLEAGEVRALGFKQPIAIIPNGISFVDRAVERKCELGRRRMLFLSRIHPKKGLIELVRAWKKANVAAEWELLIAGPDEGDHQRQVESEVRQLGLGGQIRFIGSVDDSAKWQEYANADVFVLPSYSENFGIVIAEALAMGLPAIVTKGTPWSELRTRGCGWWIEPNVVDLANAIAEATRLPAKRISEMGQIGAAWVRDTFTWESVAAQMIDFYKWLQGELGCPQCVEAVDGDVATNDKIKMGSLDFRVGPGSVEMLNLANPNEQLSA